VRVEERDRAGLGAGHLAVGVVADERSVGDAVVDALVGALRALLQPGERLLDVFAQRHERRVELGGVGHKIARLVAKDRPLRPPQRPKLEGEHDREDERNQRDAGGGEGDDALGRGQVVHGREANGRVWRHEIRRLRAAGSAVARQRSHLGTAIGAPDGMVKPQAPRGSTAFARIRRSSVDAVSQRRYDAVKIA
jgi:hypothetical protein